MKKTSMQVVDRPVRQLLHLMVLTLILCLASFITAEADPRQRVLSRMVDEDGCHETVLSNSLTSDLTLVEGVIFSLRSNGASTSVSSLSVFLDEAAISPSVGFDVYSMNGDGDNYIGTTLDGSGFWKRIHGGTIENTQLDSDGGTFLGSFGPLTIEAGEIISFYVRFTKSVIRVTHLGPNADGWDGNAINLNGNNNLQISIGRSVSAVCNTHEICIYFLFSTRVCSPPLHLHSPCRQLFGPLSIKTSSTNFILHQLFHVKCGHKKHVLQISLPLYHLPQQCLQVSLVRLKLSR